MPTDDPPNDHPSPADPAAITVPPAITVARPVRMGPEDPAVELARIEADKVIALKKLEIDERKVDAADHDGAREDDIARGKIRNATITRIFGGLALLALIVLAGFAIWRGVPIALHGLGIEVTTTTTGTSTTTTAAPGEAPSTTVVSGTTTISTGTSTTSEPQNAKSPRDTDVGGDPGTGDPGVP